MWKAENPSRPPKDPKVKDDSKAHQVHEVEDDVQLDAAPLQTQQQEAALQKVLAEEVRHQIGGCWVVKLWGTFCSGSITVP